ncbi:hypothetical protein DSM104440_01626 [Usitatibacter palustris]|uniref:Prepilin-type N-terminal cleavage/methylation domain-containing protein n=2 Tax=Usitatibacter palustris TaxID=2732487 RepID=A0A6M4H5C3_9PROT|nr:hypothetical protein DSM104440_01626 [Usitatibacter palustris]
MHTPGFRARASGFTLVEIGVVLIIMGLLLVMLIGITSSMIGNQRRAETRNKLANVETALALFVSKNLRLPCPADGAMTSANANAGLERIDMSAPPNYTCNVGGAGLQTNGVVPWRSLGLSESDATDGWGARLTYRVAPEFIRQSSMNMTACDPGGSSGAVTLVAGTGYCNAACLTPPFLASNCTSPANATVTRGLSVRNLSSTLTLIMDPANPSNTGAAYVVISHGENRARGRNSEGILLDASGIGTLEANNANDQALAGSVYVDDFQVFKADADHFDDFVLRPTILAVAAKAQLGPRAH